MLGIFTNRLMAGALSVLAFAGTCSASETAERATRGRLLALVACTYCHMVEEKQEVKPVLTISVPSFQELADDPETTEQSLRIFLRTQHTEKPAEVKMPDPALNDDQIEDVVAYILSRRQLHRANMPLRSSPAHGPS